MNAQSYTNILPEKVRLNAINPAQLANFYQTNIGMTLIDSREDHFYALGTPDQRVLLEVYPAENEGSRRTTGLYHFALLLPTRKDLAEIFKYLIEQKVPMEGAADHGYSEALYLPDPEGNGIEIYVDKDRRVWDITETGQINGVTLAIDADDLLAQAVDPFKQIPDGSLIGHFHLHVGDLDKACDFYQNIMGLGVKSSISNHVMFLASGNYHHHLGINIWNGQGIESAPAGRQGLRTVVWKANADDFTFIIEKLDQQTYPYTAQDDRINLVDSVGIPTEIVQSDTL